MRYVGSKKRICKHIIPFILEGRKENQYYVEPFCGGCNTLSTVGGSRLAADINPYLIDMLRKGINGWIPNDFYSNKTFDFSTL